MSAARMRAQAIFKRLPVDRRVYGAELGVWNGALSQLLLLREDLYLVMVDSWAPMVERAATYTSTNDKKAHVSDDKMEQARLQAIAATGFAHNRCNILHMTTADASEQVSDYVLDFVFIDADHSFEGVCADIKAWLPKVKRPAVPRRRARGQTVLR